MKPLRYDPNLIGEIPEHVREAERTLSMWMTMQGHKRWALGGCCSRNHAELLGDLARLSDRSNRSPVNDR